jgi:hypothetical protein
MWFVPLKHRNKPITLQDIKIPKAAIIRTKRFNFAVILKSWVTCFVPSTVHKSPLTLPTKYFFFNIEVVFKTKYKINVTFNVTVRLALANPSFTLI